MLPSTVPPRLLRRVVSPLILLLLRRLGRVLSSRALDEDCDTSVSSSKEVTDDLSELLGVSISVILVEELCVKSMLLLRRCLDCPTLSLLRINVQQPMNHTISCIKISLML